jgi:lysophospholipid acyltransferase (LPLAT)-like uncharacterized protein
VAKQADRPAFNLKLDPESFIARALVTVGFRLLQLWAATIRFELEDRGNLLRISIRDRLIGAIWHNRLLLLPFALKKFVPQRKGAALISASRDGTWVAELVSRFGFSVVRGSSSRKGAAAMLQLASIIESGTDVAITPDGPRGPVYRPGGGIILLAQKTGACIAPLNFEYSNCWRVRSWDGFVLPKPFAKVRFILGPPHEVGQTSTEAEFEQERERLRNAMMSLVEMR